MVSTMEDFWMTTLDNPYNLFEDADKWFMYDSLHSGGRIGGTINSFVMAIATRDGYRDSGKNPNDPIVNRAILEDVIDSLVKDFPKYNFVKVTKDSYKKQKDGSYKIIPYTKKIVAQ